jgi:hypothetical protein
MPALAPASHNGHGQSRAKLDFIHLRGVTDRIS